MNRFASTLLLAALLSTGVASVAPQAKPAEAARATWVCVGPAPDGAILFPVYRGELKKLEKDGFTCTRN